MGLGFSVSVYRQPSEGEKSQLARWDAHVGGLRWLDDLVEAGNAVLLGRNGGYPIKYSATAGVIIPILSDIDPAAEVRRYQPQGREYVEERNQTLDQYMSLDRGVISECPADETIFVDCWDQS